MGDLCGCSINWYKDEKFDSGIFIAGYLEKKLEQYKNDDNKSNIIDFIIPQGKLWLNPMEMWNFVQEYDNSKDKGRIEFEITNFFGKQETLVFTGTFQVDFGCLSFYGFDEINNEQSLHFMLKDWKLKKS